MFTDLTKYLANRTNNNEFAFVAIITETGASVGVAYQDTAGHFTMSNMPSFKVYADAMDYADTLNTKLGLSSLEAWKITASSMRASS
tara:strand:+ start:128 stop:388 length:261 start_codon:yes stop_codon:yes gene_type:complete